MVYKLEGKIRKQREWYPGACYHIMQRGIRRMELFGEPFHYEIFLLSEYPPGTKPARYHFPRRNRIISAWSDSLAVIAPGKNSGALITAQISRSMGRKVVVYGCKL